MKRIFLMFLGVSILLAGCASLKATQKKEYINFYYLQSDFDSKEDSGIFWEQPHPAKAYNDTKALLSSYLQGPSDTDCKSPFPEDTTLLSYKCQNDVAYLTLSNSFKSLSGYDLTIACSCIAKTVFGIEDVLAVQIRVKDGAIRGDELYITLREKDLILMDSSTRNSN